MAQQYPGPRYGERWSPERYDPQAHTERAARQQQWPPQPRQGYRPPAPHRAPAPPRRRWLPWAATAAAVVVIAGGTAGAYAALRPKPPLTCPQQYAAWKTGPAGTIAERIKGPDEAALSAATASDDIPQMDAAIVRLGDDARQLEADPMPACADPKGYWPQVLTRLAAAGDNAGATPGLGGLLTAEAPLKGLKPIEADLTAELARTAGVKTVS